MEDGVTNIKQWIWEHICVCMFLHLHACCCVRRIHCFMFANSNKVSVRAALEGSVRELPLTSS